MSLTKRILVAAAALGWFGTAGVTAFACTSLSQLNLSQAVGLPGTQVEVTGSSFAASQPVSLHWGGTSGAVLATAIPDASGAIGPVPLTVPRTATAGYYPVVATQAGHGGHSYSAVFEVTPVGGPAPVQATQHSAVPPAGSGIGTLAVVLMAAVGLAGVLGLGLGAATAVNHRRRVPGASRVRRS